MKRRRSLTLSLSSTEQQKNGQDKEEEEAEHKRKRLKTEHQQTSTTIEEKKAKEELDIEMRRQQLIKNLMPIKDIRRHLIAYSEHPASLICPQEMAIRLQRLSRKKIRDLAMTHLGLNTYWRSRGGPPMINAHYQMYQLMSENKSKKHWHQTVLNTICQRVQLYFNTLTQALDTIYNHEIHLRDHWEGQLDEKIKTMDLPVVRYVYQPCNQDADMFKLCPQGLKWVRFKAFESQDMSLSMLNPFLRRAELTEAINKSPSLQRYAWQGHGHLTGCRSPPPHTMLTMQAENRLIDLVPRRLTIKDGKEKSTLVRGDTYAGFASRSFPINGHSIRAEFINRNAEYLCIQDADLVAISVLLYNTTTGPLLPQSIVGIILGYLHTPDVHKHPSYMDMYIQYVLFDMPPQDLLSEASTLTYDPEDDRVRPQAAFIPTC